MLDHIERTQLGFLERRLWLNRSLGGPLLWSAVSGAMTVVLLLTVMTVDAIGRCERGIVTSQAVVWGLCGLAVGLIIFSGFYSEFRLGLHFARHEAHVIDLTPLGGFLRISDALAERRSWLRRQVFVMKTVRWLVALLLLVAFIAAFWSATGMFHGDEVLSRFDPAAVWAMLSTFVIAVPFLSCGMLTHRQLAYCGLLDWPSLPTWLAG